MLPEPTEDVARALSKLDKRIERLERLDEVFTINSGEVVINEAGLDTNFRIEGNTLPFLFEIDAGLDAVLVGSANRGGVADFRTTAVVFNEDGADRDFRVEGDTAANLFKTDAGLNAVLIGTATAGAILDCRSTEVVVNDGGAVSPSFRVESNTSTTAFHVVASDGGIFMSSLLAAAASTDVNINGANELHSVTSSRRFKKYIKSLDARFDSKLIYDLEPKSFVWRKNAGSADMVDFGVIAEDAYEIMPELVNLDSDGKPWSLRYSPLTVLMLAELQKLERRVGTLEAN